MKPSYKTNDPRGWCGDPSRGAALGRPSIHDCDEFTGRLYLQKVRIDSGGYDPNGTYWGLGDPLYWCANEDNSIDYCFRALNRQEAKGKVLERYPKAKL